MMRQVYAYEPPLEIPKFGYYLLRHPLRTLRCAGEIICDSFWPVPIKLQEIPSEFVDAVFYHERTGWRPRDELAGEEY